MELTINSKKQPLVSVCEKGKGMEQLSLPSDVAVENETGNIYIADQSNNCVKVIDSTGKYLSKFGDNEDEGKMDSPFSVAICGDRNSHFTKYPLYSELSTQWEVYL